MSGNPIKGLEECDRLHKRGKIYDTQVLEGWEKRRCEGHSRVRGK